eukprot:15313892-Alexandrium_andersonii.AAC.1
MPHLPSSLCCAGGASRLCCHLAAQVFPVSCWLLPVRAVVELPWQSPLPPAIRETHAALA